MTLTKISARGAALILATLLTACGGHLYHRVEKGETLYSIGWMYGYDYRQIARWNDIDPPYVLSPGERIRVVPPMGQSSPPLQEYRAATTSDVSQPNRSTSVVAAKTPAPVIESSSSQARVVEKSTDLQDDKRGPEAHDAQSVITAAKSAVKKLFNQAGITIKNTATDQPNWRWPTENRSILRTYSANDPARQGVDIAGEKGDPVFAAAAGRVVYAGSGLVQYGRLIIIKHNEEFLSAYAHNQKLLVKEDDVVKVGQRIADMGSTGNFGENFVNRKRAKLHFEIRRNGEPVDPFRYLPK